MLRTILASVAVFGGTVALCVGVAQANPANSMQPAHVYFGDVISGNHPNRIVKLHNGTGALERIRSIGIAGSGGGKFTLVSESPLIDSVLLPVCKVGMRLGIGQTCIFDVRVHTTVAGWWRSVLGVHFDTGNFGSAELRAHVLTGTVSGRRPAPACPAFSVRCS